MAKDLLIKGVAYSGVEKVKIPTTTEGEIASFIEAIPLVKSITTSGSYDSSTYHGSYWAAVDTGGNLLLVVVGGTDTAYESIYFVNGTLPDGVSLTKQSYYNGTSMTASMAYVAVYSGIATDIDIALDFSAVNATYDRVTCTVTITAHES